MLFLFISLVELFGVSPEDTNRYFDHFIENGTYFKCFDGSKIILQDRFNDGFVDCDDGSDEPGTGGFKKGFYCKNEGFYPKLIPHWDVDDGICQCCDGSDERNNIKIKCNNTCKEDMEAFLLIKSKLDEGIQKGFKKRENDIFYSWASSRIQAQSMTANISLNGVFEPNRKQKETFLKRQMQRFTDMSQTVMFPKHSDYIQIGRGSNGGRFRRVHENIAEFSGGSQCYIRGISRMTKIKYVCWHEEKISPIVHIKACQHEATMGTPAACSNRTEYSNLNPDSIQQMMFLIN